MLEPLGSSILNWPAEPPEIYISTGAKVSPLTACEFITKKAKANKHISAILFIA